MIARSCGYGRVCNCRGSTLIDVCTGKLRLATLTLGLSFLHYSVHSIYQIHRVSLHYHVGVLHYSATLIQPLLPQQLVSQSLVVDNRSERGGAGDWWSSCRTRRERYVANAAQNKTGKSAE